MGKRTVYTYSEIEQLCSQNVLAIKFRLIKVLDRPIGIDLLLDNGVIRAAPQSITQITNVGWLIEELGLPSFVVDQFNEEQGL